MTSNSPADVWTRHRQAVQRLRESDARIPAGQPVRLAKQTSNLFRHRSATTAPGLDVDMVDGDQLAPTLRSDVEGDHPPRRRLTQSDCDP